MKNEGYIITCDVCGRSEFTKYNRLFDSNSKALSPIAGWGYNTEAGDLCPNCNKEYQRIVKEYKENLSLFKRIRTSTVKIDVQNEGE